MRVKDKSIIVTGSGGGIGEGIALRLAAEGAKVIVNDINVALGEKVVAAITQAGGTASFFAADVTKSAEVKALVDAAVPDGQIALRAPMAGKLVQFNAQPGQTLAAGSEALVLEAMKMQHGITAPGAGQVVQLCVAAGDFVAEGQLLMTLALVDQAEAAAADAPAHDPALVPDRFGRLVDPAVGAEHEIAVEAAGEPAVVSDGDDGAVKPLEPLLERLGRLQVEVVGGLVEEQHRGT